MPLDEWFQLCEKSVNQLCPHQEQLPSQYSLYSTVRAFRYATADLDCQDFFDEHSGQGLEGILVWGVTED